MNFVQIKRLSDGVNFFYDGHYLFPRRFMWFMSQMKKDVEFLFAKYTCVTPYWLVLWNILRVQICFRHSNPAILRMSISCSSLFVRQECVQVNIIRKDQVFNETISLRYTLFQAVLGGGINKYQTIDAPKIGYRGEIILQFNYHFFLKAEIARIQNHRLAGTFAHIFVSSPTYSVDILGYLFCLYW